MATNAVIALVPGESVESGLRRLKKAVSNQKTLTEVRRHESFIPRAAKRRSKAHQARMRRAKHAPVVRGDAL